MKKKLMLLAMTALIAASAFAMVTSTVILLRDDCKKCRRTEDGGYCGKCKAETMYNYKTEALGNGWFKVTLKCKKESCGHMAIFKEKDD